MDISLFNFLYSFAHRSPLFDALIVFFGSYIPFLLGIAFFLAPFFCFSDWRKRMFLFLGLALSALLSRGLFVPLIRFAYHRPRPFVAMDLDALITSSSFSFPSGHAILFFALSFFLLFFAKKAGVLFLFASLVVSLFRVVAGAHYPSDILGGMVLGALAAFIVFQLLPSRAIFPRSIPTEDHKE
ncbi:MAG: phosphatase PAP2 family protein [Nanoarchaeota archaeon]|nr:phosphatase PAP2 family protein [Nanoarchaeota archaeon]